MAEALIGIGHSDGPHRAPTAWISGTAGSQRDSPVPRGTSRSGPTERGLLQAAPMAGGQNQGAGKMVVNNAVLTSAPRSLHPEGRVPAAARAPPLFLTALTALFVVTAPAPAGQVCVVATVPPELFVSHDTSPTCSLRTSCPGSSSDCLRSFG